MCQPAWWLPTLLSGGRDQLNRSNADTITPQPCGRTHGSAPTTTRVGTVSLNSNEHRRTSRAVAHGALILPSNWVALLACQQ